MAGRQLLLHIGTHQTGTTSFQYFLGDNHAALLSSGVDILTDDCFDRSGPIYPFNIAATAHHFIRPDLRTGPRVQSLLPEQSDRRIFEDRLVERINDSPCLKVVGSAEAFCFMRSEEELDHIARFLKRIDRTVCFFVVFREEVGWRRSRFAQIKRSSLMADSAASSVPEPMRITGDWYFDKSAIRNFWSRLGRLVELDYQAHSDIRIDLTRHMEIDIDGLSIGPNRNVSPEL